MLKQITYGTPLLTKNLENVSQRVGGRGCREEGVGVSLSATGTPVQILVVVAITV